jgi:hypothetical protein
VRRQWRRANDRGGVTLEPKALGRGQDPVRRLPEGSGGGRCFANASCFDGLYCDPSSFRCRRGNRGLEGGECLEGGACSGGLICIDAVCIESSPPNCKTDEHCPQGRTCQYGHCLEPNAPAPAPDPAPDPQKNVDVDVDGP